VGTESRAEYLDLELFGVQSAEGVARRVAAHLPDGFRLLGCEELKPGGESLNRVIRGIEYRVELPDEVPDAGDRLAQFLAAENAVVVRQREGKDPIRIDLKKAVDAMVATGPREIRFTLRSGENEAVARPSELLSAIFGAELTAPGVARIVRESAIFGAPAA
jgi:radical SAM-linked protein